MTRKPTLGDLALAQRILADTETVWSDPEMTTDAAEVERRHIAEQRRLAYRHQRRLRGSK